MLVQRRFPIALMSNFVVMLSLLALGLGDTVGDACYQMDGTDGSCAATALHPRAASGEEDSAPGRSVATAPVVCLLIHSLLLIVCPFTRKEARNVHVLKKIHRDCTFFMLPLLMKNGSRIDEFV
jgi:hypothetical protein